MLSARQRIAPQPTADVVLTLPFELRQKSRLRASSADGVEVGLFLERGTVLRGGDCLRADDGRVIRIVAAPEDLMEARAAAPEDLARAAYHLGNRHTPVQVGAGWLRFAADHVLADMLATLGASIRRLSAPFEPEAGAYASGHQHHSGEAKHTGVIHDFARVAGTDK